jgi:hypothetical protein
MRARSLLPGTADRRLLRGVRGRSDTAWPLGTVGYAEADEWATAWTARSRAATGQPGSPLPRVGEQTARLAAATAG